MMIWGKEIRGAWVKNILKKSLTDCFIYTWTSEERIENDGYRDICTLSVNPDWCCIFFFSSYLPEFIGNADDTTLREIFLSRFSHTLNISCFTF